MDFSNFFSSAEIYLIPLFTNALIYENLPNFAF